MQNTLRTKRKFFISFILHLFFVSETLEFSSYYHALALRLLHYQD